MCQALLISLTISTKPAVLDSLRQKQLSVVSACKLSRHWSTSSIRSPTYTQPQSLSLTRSLVQPQGRVFGSNRYILYTWRGFFSIWLMQLGWISISNSDSLLIGGINWFLPRLLFCKDTFITILILDLLIFLRRCSYKFESLCS